MPQTSGFRSAKQILVVSFATQARAFILSDRNIFYTPGGGEQRRGLMPLGLFLFQFGFTHTKTHFQPLKLPDFCLFPKCVKCLCFKEPPNHINKAKLQVTPIDKSRRVLLKFKIKVVCSVANCLKASARYLFNVEPDFCLIN